MRPTAGDLLGLVRRGLRKPPSVIAKRIAHEARAELDRFLAPQRARLVNDRFLLAELCAESMVGLWERMACRPYAVDVSRRAPEDYERVCPGDARRIFDAAEHAHALRVDLLGSGVTELSDPIDWHTDFKTGMGWPAIYFRSIDYNNPERPSDVKTAWELSRAQWLIPLGQAFLLDGDDRHASRARACLEQWIAANPYAIGVNWACTMEVALRIVTWSWLFHAFNRAASWQDAGFRSAFLRALYLHGDFTVRHLERSDINGNHYTANAAGLVFAGLFFGAGAAPARWLRTGWEILCAEMPRQVFDDGVDFEASAAYHRLVLELYLLSVMYRINCGQEVAGGHTERLRAMARFVAAYSQPDGQAPHWGDADDARALPFARDSLADHRYLVGLIGKLFEDRDLLDRAAGPRSEAAWCLGLDAARHIPLERTLPAESLAFTTGGVYVMAQGRDDHVFVDCGPIGLAGRGGHGHNDCMSFEAVLAGERIVVDPGCYVYTASYTERNVFRSTAYHNTPCIDGEEINRFVRPDYLWNLHYDAVPSVHEWRAAGARDVLRCTHRGYQRLTTPIMPERTFVLDRHLHALAVHDRFAGEGVHEVNIPLHLAPGVALTACEDDHVLLRVPGGNLFRICWSAGYEFKHAAGRFAPSYGRVVPIVRLEWSRRGALHPFSLTIAAANHPRAAIAAALSGDM